jgi:hypothetical protein
MRVRRNDEIPVSVDRDFARFGSKSYAINKINSVDVRARHPHSQTAALGWGLAAAICLIIAFGQSSASADTGDPAAVLCFGALFGFLAFRAWKRSKVVEYQLFLVTSSGAVQAIKSEDPSVIDGLRNRIERAMSGHLV